MPTYEELLKMGAKPPQGGGLTYEQLIAQGAKPQTEERESPSFFTGLRESLGIPGSFEEAKQTLTGLAGLLTPSGATAFAKNVYGQQAEQFSKAGEALRRGSLSEMLGYSAAGALPLVGPAAARAGETIGQGDTAYGLGQTLGLIAPFGVGAAARIVRSAIPTPPPLVRQTVGERLRSPALMRAEGIAERTIPGAAPFQKFRAAQQLDLRNLSDRLVRNISEFQGPAEELGNRLKTALEQTKASIKQSIGAEYAQIDRLVGSKRVRQQVTRERPSTIVGAAGEPLTVPTTITKMVEEGGVGVSTAPLKTFVRPLIRRIRQESKIIPPEELKRTATLLQRIAKAPNEVSFTAFNDARSDLLSIARSYGDPIPGKAGGIAKKLSQLSTETMEAAARDSGIPDLLPRVRAANKRWAQLVKDYDETVVKRILDEAPEKAYTYLQKAPLEDIRTVKRLSPEKFNEATARIIQDAIDKATEGEVIAPTGLQRVEQAIGARPTPTLKVKKLRQMLEDPNVLGTERLQALLSPERARELYSLLDEAEKIGLSTSNLVSGAVNGYLAFRGLQAVTNPLGSLTDVAAIYAPVNLFSRLMVRQPKGWMSALRNYARAAGSKNATQAAFWSQRLGQFLQSEEGRTNTTAQTSPRNEALEAGSLAESGVSKLLSPTERALPAPGLSQLLSTGAPR